jgi:tetratricopeptide (TPR) repeat protein
MVMLLDAWVRAQGGEGQLVTLIGDAGVGKSRLVAEVIDRVAANSAVRIVRARCLSYGQEIALWLVADLLRSLFGLSEGETQTEIRAKLGAALPGLLATADAATQAEALDVLGEVLGLPPGESRVGRAEAQIRRQALIRSLKLVLGALSERAPTVLVLEDMHWVDVASQDVLKEILSDVPGLRLLSLVAQRPGWIAPWSEWGWTERITLRPLGDRDTAVLAGAVLGGAQLAPELERHVTERAGGNPFFVEELLRALEDTGGLVERDGMTTLGPGAAQRLPSTLTEVLLARLDRLDGEVRTVAQVASVIGRSFAVRLLSEVMAQAPDVLELPLSALQQAEIAFPRRGADLEYVFKHVTLRDVAYNTLVQKRRQELHLLTARAIAALYPTDEYVDIIAYHYARTTEHGEAAAWLERAGDRASGIYAMDTAIANYQEARARQEMVGGAPAVLARLDEKLGEAFVNVARSDDAIPVLERSVEAYRGVRDLEGAGRSASLLGGALGSAGRAAEGLTRIEPMVELLSWSGPSSALASLHITRSRIFQVLGRYEEMLAEAERAAEIATAIGDERWLAWAMERQGTACCHLGRSDEAVPLLEDATARLERVGDLQRLNTAQTNLGEAHRQRGELQDARRFNERAVETAERVGNPANVAFGLMNLGEILLSLGAWDEAREHLERAEEVLSTLPSASDTAAYIPSILGRVLLAQGLWGEAEAALQQALAMAVESEDRQVLEITHTTLAELEVLRGEPRAAIARLEPLAGQEGGFQVMIESVLAWALSETGDVHRADVLTEEALQLGRSHGERLALPETLRVRGMVLESLLRSAEARAALEEGLALAQSLPTPYTEARILEGLGRTEEALGIFQRLGAAKDIERLERQPARPGPSTAAE